MGLVTGIKAALWGKPTYRDLLEADPEAARLKSAVERDDLGVVVETLRQLRGGSWEDRHFLCEVVAHHAPLEALERLCQGDPRGAIPLLLRAAKLIVLAWEARNASDTLTSRSWSAFEQHLATARACLRRAEILDPVDPTPHVYMVTIARGLHLSHEVAWEHFQKAVDRAPHHVPAHAAMLELLSPTWGGSLDSMFAFARKAVASAPEGNEIWMLLLLAHLERWHFAYVMEGDEATAKAWVGDPAVQQEVLHGYGRSLLSEWHVRGRYTPQRRNEAAFWFYLSGETSRLRHEMTLIGDVCTESPWCYLGSPHEVFAAAKKSAKSG